MAKHLTKMSEAGKKSSQAADKYQTTKNPFVAISSYMQKAYYNKKYGQNATDAIKANGNT